MHRGIRLSIGTVGRPGIKPKIVDFKSVRVQVSQDVDGCEDGCTGGVVII